LISSSKRLERRGMVKDTTCDTQSVALNIAQIFWKCEEMEWGGRCNTQIVMQG
jgi:hypothetical protein